ncbi:uncharacterized protein N7483_002641 [Penicillium malachiteum]|uniref:uncharacterized protein n=1 Tax=Penicillium malachiteum TaxID=1324776 RepID=UPI002547D82F|nr:uncharacterized protein N7483_002641 [Penicillium malachiteum]KAJ5737516.1 hypothetical protein N7483_002641 [Penicillium malachiteum]
MIGSSAVRPEPIGDLPSSVPAGVVAAMPESSLLPVDGLVLGTDWEPPRTAVAALFLHSSIALMAPSACALFIGQVAKNTEYSALTTFSLLHPCSSAKASIGNVSVIFTVMFSKNSTVHGPTGVEGMVDRRLGSKGSNRRDISQGPARWMMGEERPSDILIVLEIPDLQVQAQNGCEREEKI